MANPPQRDPSAPKTPWEIRATEFLLGHSLPLGIAGRSILGDLREEFHSDLRRMGRARASIRHLGRATAVSLRFLGPKKKIPGNTPVHTKDRDWTMNAFSQDLRKAFRLLFRKPGLALAAVVSLGLGIGANTAVFSLVDTILLKPLPYPEAHELVEAFRVDERVTGLSPTPNDVSGLWAVPYQVHLDWLEMGRVFQAGGGYAGTRVLLQDGERTTWATGILMTSGAFDALQIQPLLGRTFLPEDDEVGASPVVVLGYGFWQSYHGGDPNIVGNQIVLGETSYTVTGVMPRAFAFPNDAYRLWISFSDELKTSPTRLGGYLKVVARLAPGITIDEARREMEPVAVRIGEAHPEEAEHRVGFFPQKAMIIGDTGPGLLILLGAVSLVLLIACTNIAGLFLVRATERQREIGVKRALGAGQRRLVSEQLMESLLLSLMGGAAGFGLAVVGLKPLLSLMPNSLPRMEEMSVNSDLLLTAISFSVFTGILIGVLPALRAARTPITTVLQESGRSLTGGRKRNRTQVGLVVSQIALAFVLLSGAGLMVRSMAGLFAVDIGFDTENLALAYVSYPSGAEDVAEAGVYFQELEDRISALPGVLAVGSADQMPFAGGWSAPPVTIETLDGERDVALHIPTVTPGYFAAMDIPILAGRGLSKDDTSETEPVMVVSQRLAETMAPGGSPLGLRIRVNTHEDVGQVWWTVVGVVADVRYRLTHGAMSMAYASQGQSPSNMDNWVIRTASDPLPLGSAVQRIREELDPEGTSSYQSLANLVEGSDAAVSARFSVILLGGLAGLAALLAVFGVYGVLSYLVQLRSREIGIQLALGAERGKVVGGILRRGLIMGGIGLLCGTGLALGMGRLVESQLFGVQPWDPYSLGGAGLLLMLATVLASYIPARRASRLNPVDILKGE